jgi:hypothetical protein
MSQNPFAVLTFIVAPAILTNATSMLAMSTINRMLRTRDRMHELYVESAKAPGEQHPYFLNQVSQLEVQAVTLLTALRWIYLALGSFATASLVTLVGAVAAELGSEVLMIMVVVMGLLLGIAGVSGIVGGCVCLLKATHVSLQYLQQEAALIRERQAKPAAQNDSKASAPQVV